jgi:sulfoxide reductase heme-binding subunit YedZ
VHWFGYLCWPIAMFHGLGIGTDRSQVWVVILAVACGGAVLVACVVRVVDLLPSRRLAP